MKRLLVIAVLVISMVIGGVAFAGVTAKQISETVCIDRIGPRDDRIKIIRIQDPENPFVAIFFTTIKSGAWTSISDPSNTSISARLIGPIPVDKNGKRLINKKATHDIASIRKSIGTKIMKIGRYYDVEMDTLCYLVYTTKMMDGSLKHSISVVPLGNPVKL